MKIVFNSDSNDLTNEVIQIALDEGSDVVPAKTERILFAEIGKENIDGFIIQNHKSYTQRAIDFIKRKTPYIPIIILMEIQNKWPANADFYVLNPGMNIQPASFLYEACKRTIISYNTNFDKLKRITAKIRDELSFGDCKYNPPRRTFHYKERYIKKMSPKEGGVMEILAANFGAVVRKEIILEKVWYKTSFYTGRSLDVFLTNLRKLFKEEDIPLIINTIPNAGLILEHK